MSGGKWWSHEECDRLWPEFTRCDACRAWAEGRIGDAQLFAIRAEDDGPDVARCPACGEFVDYCQGHGEIGDPAGALVLAMHDAGDHAQCVRDGNGECVAL